MNLFLRWPRLRPSAAITAVSAVVLVATHAPCAHAADVIGSVDTVFKFIGPDHKIVVDAYDDPGVAGVTC